MKVEEEYHPEWAPLLEAVIVDIADSIAYTAHDVDDGVKAGLITVKQLEEMELWREGAAEVARRVGDEVQGQMRVRMTVRRIINRLVGDLIQNTHANMERLGIQSLEDVRKTKEPVAALSPEVDEMKTKLKSFLYQNVYCHHRVLMMQEKASRFIRELFGAYVSNVKQLPTRFRAWSDKVGVERAVSDYIAGMTDRYAQGEYKKLFHPFEHIL
jgi:dGTPase